MATMKFSSRGISKIKIPAIRATMAGTCAAVMVIQMPPADLVKKSNRGPQLTRWRGSGIGDACGANGFRPPENLPGKLRQENYDRKNYKIAPGKLSRRKTIKKNCREKPQENCKQKRQENLPRKMPEIAAYETTLSRNNAARDELARIVRWLAGAHPREGVDHAEQDTCHCSDRRRAECTDRGAGAERHRGHRARRHGHHQRR